MLVDLRTPTPRPGRGSPAAAPSAPSTGRACGYLDAAVTETLRLRPIAPVGGLRLVKQPLAIGGYVLPPGTTVGSCAYLTFKDPTLYPEPEQYRPERFLDAKVDPYAFAAFGGGIRRCLGMAFALNLLKGVIAIALSRAPLAIISPYARPAATPSSSPSRPACRSSSPDPPEADHLRCDSK